MPKCLMVYFSQGQTTARVAESIATGLRAAEYQVDLYNLRDGEVPGLDGYDLLGIGSPAYYYRPPFNVTEYVRGLPKLEGMPAFVFVLHGTMPGDAGNQIRETLTRKGSREVGYFHCFGADFYVGYLKKGYLFSPDHPTPGELARAETFGREVAGHVSGLPYARPQFDPAPGAVYRFERIAASRWLAETLSSRLFLVDKKKCVACGTCVQGCPTGTIGEDSEGRPVWGRDCLLCMYCEMNCPEEAITSPASWPLFAPFMEYNIRAASKNQTIDHVRVKHSQGRTKRV